MAGLLRYLEPVRSALKLDLLKEATRQYPVFCFLLGTLLSLTVLLNRHLHVLMVFWSFLAGLVTFYCSLSRDTLLPSVLSSPRSRHERQEQELFPSGLSCAVCGKNKCKRHRPTLRLENHQPWLDLKVHSKVDASIAEMFELVLENFVFPWYRDISTDHDCVDEIRTTFRFFASVLVRRAQKVDVPAVFADKVMKAAMKHLEVVNTARDRVSRVEELQRAALLEYGSHLHIALRSRREELQYLRTLTEMLLPHVLPPKATVCRSLSLLLREVMAGSVILPTMDFMADPDTVNLMVLLFVDDTPPEAASEPPSPLVPFLHRYASATDKKSSVLKLELKQIRDQQDLLFRFMNFLKQEGAVHVLQFCLTVEEFNDRILQPELSDSQLLALHSEVVHIYETYCLDESIDKISFDTFIIEEIRKIAMSPYTEVVRLQKMTCLFEAYEHVLSLLENVFTPMFCHSDEYFRHLLRGVESPTRNSKISRSFSFDESCRNASRRGEASGISRIGSKIKGVFKSTTLEGAMLPPSAMADPDDDLVEEATMVQEGDYLSEPQSWSASGSGLGCSPVFASGLNSGSGRNLSEWSAWIPFIDVMEDEVRKERVPAFLIQVQRDDRRGVGHEAESWCVLRRYMEFYVLESKLTEFHGPFPDAQLPSKRILGPKNYEFLESKRLEFEEYLQTLLRVPELSNSQLLADFLSPHSIESQFTDKMIPDVNLGKIFKSVPGKLMKEKGQNLEPFIQSFFNSCESPKPKPSRNELTVLSPTAHTEKKLFTPLYQNNANLCDLSDRKCPQNYFLEQQRLHGMFDYMMFVARVLFRVPASLHHFLCALRIVAKRSFEAYLDQLMHQKLTQILQEHRLVSLITQLRDAVFCEDSEERSAEDKQLRAKQTFEEMMSYLPDFVSKLIGEEAKYEGVRLLFDTIQQPLLNKQMTYVLLDIAVQELFPELSKVPVGEAFVV
ncbi:sorting nexin-14-like isoform X1 [Periophthalmus magnuspinnatus]|uniref:sorting nexin-14-like isoform X1 n=1 Tax=Periophthalmus magnuspinnatus TaxID=409849 RepID=UPI00243638E9|nr:sorting nexin-14-like isoform X1 [Periophthalmus magnuspinnatus]